MKLLKEINDQSDPTENEGSGISSPDVQAAARDLAHALIHAGIDITDDPDGEHDLQLDIGGSVIEALKQLSSRMLNTRLDREDEGDQEDEDDTRRMRLSNWRDKDRSTFDPKR